MYYVIVYLCSFTAVITVAPSSVTTSLYTLTNFTCEGIGTELSWTVQGNSLSNLIKQYREISVTTNNISVGMWSSVLTIRALPINDGISVGCIVFGQNFNFVAKGATLTVKGLKLITHYYFIQCTGISQVEILQLNFSFISSSNWLTWSSPLFSSENSVISYHIYIENQYGRLLYNDITEDTSYVLYNLTVCDIYTATVIASSGEYSSSNVTIQREYSGGMLTISFLF